MDALRAHQFRIDEALAEELLEEAEKLPIFYNLPVAHDIRTAFKMETLNSIHEQFGYQSSFFNRRQLRSKPFSPANLSRLVGHLQSAMGMSTIFHMDVQASDNVQQPFAIYLKVNHEGMHKSEFLHEFIRRNSRGVSVSQSVTSVLKAINDLKSACTAVSQPLEYEKWSLNSINRRWSELDFPEYFRSLAKQQEVQPELRELLEDGELEFFIESPDCFTALNDLLRSKGTYDRHTFVANLMTYLALAQKSEFLVAFPLKDVPYRLECVAELRQNVPHFMGKLYWEVLEHRERYKENVTALKSSFHVYYRSLMRAFLEFVEHTKGFKQAFALEKLRNVGQAHSDLSLASTGQRTYFAIQNELRRFAFLQKIHQLIEDDEYNRQRPFEKLCSATVQMTYSRAGNWLQISLGILTLPQLKLDKVQAFKYTNLFKYSILGRQLVSEVSKAIDSEGKWWFANGLFRSIDKFGPSFSLQNTEECYRNQLLLLSEDEQEDSSKNIQMAINDIFGITVSMAHLKQQYQKEMSAGAVVESLLERYLTELQPYYCALGHHTSNSYQTTTINEHQVILKDFLQSLIVDRQLFGCTGLNHHLTTHKCEINFDEDDGVGIPDGALYDEDY
uniref:Uncharacterized protein n=1 Tax=Ditylenchus dipsaci TaxID=166011 RepID=A0A915DXW5_9BILA